MSLGQKKITISKCAILSMTMFVVLSCKQQNETLAPDYTAAIQNLTSDERKREYLEAIFKADQDVRNAEEEYAIKSTYGLDSKEFMEHLSKMKETDAINLNKVEAYLQYFDHPIKTDLGEIATLTPWVVIHHASDYEPRVVNFKYLYKGYKNGDLEEGSFSMYLARMYQRKMGKRLDMGGPYKEEDKIIRMIKELGLK